MTLKEGNILITVSGPDHPGITSKLMAIIAENGHTVLDMGQSVTHGLLSLSILLGGEREKESSVLKDLLFAAKNMKLSLDFQVVEDGWHEQTEHDVFILSCVSLDTIPADFVAQTASLLANYKINIKRIDNITKGFKCLEVATETPLNCPIDKVKEGLINISNQYKVDLAFLKDNMFRRSKRLIVFDMDSTLIQKEVIDEMATLHGVGDEIKAITHAAMNGEIDFNESLIKRVSKLKGLQQNKLEEIAMKIPLNPGVEDFIKTVKGFGFKTALISGGFTYFTNYFKDKLGLDYAFGNELEISSGVLTGNITGTIISPQQKALILDLIAQQENINIEQVVAIGDGANDLPMLSKAGLGIAFHAKEAVRKNAPHQIGHGPMTSVLYFLGIPGPLSN